MTSEHSTDKNHLEALWRLRQSIDNIDAAIIYMLAERFKCTREIGRLKAQYKLPPTDQKREKEQTERLRSLAEASSLDPDFAERLFRVIVSEVVNNHKTTALSPRNRTQ
ncbi:chorismate mutase [Acetobacteraceae bacterium ESL0709]|nr:chorismate mutase [Acetobacteraceae bacterium ESL0697]MDF7678226.1 chorismate mutase [Acetobacteraceae bacterium ESL0709]